MSKHKSMPAQKVWKKDLKKVISLCFFFKVHLKHVKVPHYFLQIFSWCCHFSSLYRNLTNKESNCRLYPLPTCEAGCGTMIGGWFAMCSCDGCAAGGYCLWGCGGGCWNCWETAAAVTAAAATGGSPPSSSVNPSLSNPSSSSAVACWMAWEAMAATMEAATTFLGSGSFLGGSLQTKKKINYIFREKGSRVNAKDRTTIVGLPLLHQLYARVSKR